MVALDSDAIYWALKQTHNKCKQCFICLVSKALSFLCYYESNLLWKVLYPHVFYHLSHVSRSNPVRNAGF